MEINRALRDHQVERSGALRALHIFLPLIIKRFYGTLPLPALSWEAAHPRCLGWYIQKDGLSLSHRINLNSLYANRPLPEILQTLTHELGHCWQNVQGKPAKQGFDNYHNREFQRKMREVGIPCNKHGVTPGIQEPFVGFLKGLGVETGTFAFPFRPEIQTPPARKGSHLKPWACKCTRVWASLRVELSATCNECGNPFEPK